jgi:hypothetical protein
LQNYKNFFKDKSLLNSAYELFVTINCILI